MKCLLCPRACNAERTESQNINGYCKMPLLPRVARAALHFWEEPCISGTKGSGTVFFSGCSLSCVFCQNYEISHNGFGKTVSINRLSEIFRELEAQGAHNINLVNPTHYAYAIKQALDIYRPKIPIVYNSGGYDRAETLKELDGCFDIFLMDLKYLNSDRARLYSGAADYPKFAETAILECCRQQPECVFDGNGIMQKGVIVRHLILPLGTKEAVSVFDWVRENAPGVFFSIMSQYVPCGRAGEYPLINRQITKREYEKVLYYICASDFENVYFQQRTSADGQYIPPFDLSGIL